MAVDDTLTLGGGGYLADRLVEIGSTVAIADSIAFELASAPRAELQDYTLVDIDEAESNPFDLEAAASTLLVKLAHDRDAICTGVEWPQCYQSLAVLMDFERPAD